MSSEQPTLPAKLDNPVEQLPQTPAGLYSESGKLLFASPSQNALAAFTEADGRVSYFQYRFRDWNKEKPEDEDLLKPPAVYTIPGKEHVTFPFPDNELRGLDEINSLGIPKNIFNMDCVLPPLVHYLHQKYSGREIAVRGTACSVSTEPIAIGEKHIRNPVEILRAGVEHNGEYAAMNGFDQEHPEVAFRSLQWLTQHPEEIRKNARKEGKQELAKHVFPVLLVYDRTKFPPGKTTLPESPEERSMCILEAIVLDYPLSRQEYREQ